MRFLHPMNDMIQVRVARDEKRRCPSSEALAQIGVAISGELGSSLR